MTTELELHVGDDLETVAARFAAAWHRAERGGDRAEHHVSFEDFAALAAVMTPKRLALLRHVHRQPPKSIRALAQALGRDYRRVHDDVEALLSAGLLDRDEHGLTAAYDSVHVETRIAL